MPHLKWNTARALLLLSVLATLSCSDGIPTEVVPAASSSEYIHCLVDVVGGEMRCVKERGMRGDPPSIRPLLLERLFDFTLRASDAVYTPQDSTLSAMVDVRAEMMWEPIGTPDGHSVTGLKVFIEGGPYIALFRDSTDTSDPWFRNQTVGSTGPGGVTLLNPDGFASFTGPNQPYMEYLEILAPGQWSARKEWRFRVPPEALLIGFRAKVFSTVEGEEQVPLVAPDTVPAGFYDSTNILLSSPYFGLSERILKDIVAVRFAESATREERQAAVEVVRGSVVGGYRLDLMEGYYFIRVPDDGTGAGIRAAVDTLGTLPTVATAQPEYLWIPAELASTLEPEDSGDHREPWQWNPSQANGNNWALEAIAAPDAWGCTTGSGTVKMALLDMGFFSNPDLVPNVTYAPAMDAYDEFGMRDEHHGTAVASVIGAKGNNGIGITGVMWNADLRLYEISVRDNGDRNISGNFFWREPVPFRYLMERRLQQAIQAGADVITIPYEFPATSRRNIAPADVHAEIAAMAENLRALIAAQPHKPLVVVGAGNEGYDAYWAVLPLLAQLLPDQVIAVAGVRAVSDNSATMWANTNRNLDHTLVEIAAPGENVGALSASGTRTADGTSLAAPLVAGVAGLLKSFDPRLTTAQIKELLLEGARRGGRQMPTGGTVFVVNAYHSLAAAAEELDAPLCGGVPVWRDAEFGLVQARRFTGTTVGSLTSLFMQSGSTLIPMHGESTIRVDDAYYGWFNGSWLQYPTARVDAYGNATNRSKLGQSHDGDSIATFNRVELSDSTEEYQVRINGQLLQTVPSVWAKEPSTTLCVIYHRTNSGCTSQINAWKNRVTTHAAIGYSPRGDELVLSISKQMSTQFVVDVPYPCMTDYYCQDYEFRVSTLASELVFIRIADGQIVERRPGPIRMVNQIGYSEDGQRLVMDHEFTYYDHQYNVSGGWAPAPINTWYCQGHYISRLGNTLNLTLPLKRQTANCYRTATFSP